MGKPIEVEEYRGYKIEIHVDEFPTNPLREWDNLGTIVAWHRRMNLGNSEDYDPKDYDSASDLEAEIAKDCLYLPVYIYQHGGIVLNTTGFHCPWDSGLIGFIYVSRKKVRDEYSVKRISRKLRARIYEYLKNEVEIYSYFQEGAVYGYKVRNEDGDEIDDCWGFYGYDHKKSGLMECAREVIDSEVQNGKLIGLLA